MPSSPPRSITTCPTECATRRWVSLPDRFRESAPEVPRGVLPQVLLGLERIMSPAFSVGTPVKSWFTSRWFAPGRRPPRAVKKSPIYRLPLRLEQLETRTVPTTITRTSAPIFYTSFAPSSGPALTSHYVAYQITNTDGVNYPDVWATIGNFSGGAVTLGAHATDMINLGPLRTAKPKPRSSTCGPPFLPPMSLRLIP